MLSKNLSSPEFGMVTVLPVTEAALSAILYAIFAPPPSA
jgi:hypothetical protein